MYRSVYPAVSATVLFLASGFCAVATSCHSQKDLDVANERRARADSTELDRPAETFSGWLSWRGPQQNGTSLETDLPSKVSMDSPGSWQYTLRGRGTPTIASGRVFVIGYEGDGEDLQEVLLCLDEKDGSKIWEHRYTDYVSDVIYSRYAIGSPTVDPETGNVYFMTTPGTILAFDRDGELLWQHSAIEAYGRLTFPNGRTGAVLIDGPRAIVHIISSGWGKQAPARDRFFAFDKKTGTNLWSCTPGGPPKDSSFSFPVVADVGGRRLLYAGLGGGYVACVDTRTGDPVWRFQMSIGGINSNPVLAYSDDRSSFDVIAIHGKENLDSSTIGRMVRLKHPAVGLLGATPAPNQTLDKSAEMWRNDLVAFTSSPVLVGNRVYETTLTGDLNCVDVDTGKVLWHEKLAPDQIHASPVWGDGKLYVPMNNGSFHIVEPGDDGCKVLQSIQLEGACVGAPAIAGGRIYVHSTEKLYCFAGGRGKAPAQPFEAEPKSDGKIVRLQLVPGDHCAKVGDKIEYRVRGLDARGLVVSESMESVTLTGLPTDHVELGDDLELRIASDAPPMTATITAESNGMKCTGRLRVVPTGNFFDDFQDAKLTAGPDGTAVANPRSFWVGATKKWEILDREGNQVLAKTLANPLFQRTMSMIGHPDESNYTMQADILTDGNRRTKSTGGLVNQRYLITLKGNYQTIEVSSNMERLKQSVPFKIKTNTWYRLKTRVDLNPDGSGIVRAKAWPRDEPEPATWTIEVNDPHAHKNGAPGIYGFVPQSRFRVYLDNISVTKND